MLFFPVGIYAEYWITFLYHKQKLKSVRSVVIWPIVSSLDHAKESGRRAKQKKKANEYFCNLLLQILIRGVKVTYKNMPQFNLCDICSVAWPTSSYCCSTSSKGSRFKVLLHEKLTIIILNINQIMVMQNMNIRYVILSQGSSDNYFIVF